MRKTVCTILVLFLLLCICPITVSANSPELAPIFLFDFENLPEGTKYVDLLVELPDSNTNFVPVVYENLPDGFSEDAPIVSYYADGFRSYTFHYADAKSMIKIKADGSVIYFADERNHTMWEHEKDIHDRGKIRLALLDESGNILKVSRTFSIRSTSMLYYQLNRFHYDAQEDTLLIDTEFSIGGACVFALLSVAGIVLTCFLEEMIAIPFKLLKPYGTMITLTNLVSQIVMRLLHILLYNRVFTHYWWLVLVLEVLVYSGEFVFYRWKMKAVSKSRVLWYTVAANTVSLVIGAIPMMIA